MRVVLKCKQSRAKHVVKRVDTSHATFVNYQTTTYSVNIQVLA